MDSLDKLDAFFADQLQWARTQASSNSSALWTHVGLVLRQLDGLHDGYNFAATLPHNTLPALNMSAFLLLNGLGDSLDLLSALYPSTRPDWEQMTPTEREAQVANSGHCSGLIKVTGNFSDMFMAHSSWFVYQSMLRIYKHYHFAISVRRRSRGPSLPSPLSPPPSPGAAHGRPPRLVQLLPGLPRVPGRLLHDGQRCGGGRAGGEGPRAPVTVDGTRARCTGLVMVQTTNNVFNHTLYDLVTPHSLMAWQRVRVASQMARTGAEWAETVAAYNSGTYNNQYMVVDLSKFERGKGVHEGLLVVVEQIPGLVVSGDQTEILMYGYWPSYNVPFYREIYERSGYSDMLRRFGAHGSGLSGLDYQNAPRAKIFRRDAGGVVDMASLRAIMRYNDYTHDPYAHGSPYAAICSRGDLAAHPSPGGCYDSKVCARARRGGEGRPLTRAALGRGRTAGGQPGHGAQLDVAGHQRAHCGGPGALLLGPVPQHLAPGHAADVRLCVRDHAAGGARLSRTAVTRASVGPADATGPRAALAR